MTRIHQILNIQPTHQTFTFEGRSFDYYPAGLGTIETLYTRWADAPRAVSADIAGGQVALEQAVAVLLVHKFKRGVSATERAAILDRFRARGL